jgi:glycerophosphoryl diester phosphodiesterase
VGHRYAYLDAPTPIGFAHRGGAAAGDENTTVAFGRAVELGYRYIETDAHATADGVAVAFHDDTIERLLGRPADPKHRRVRDLRWADLSTLRVGGAAAVPRLDEVVDAWPQVRFNIDAKDDLAVGPVVDVVRRCHAEERVLLASFSDARLARMRKAAGASVATSLGMRGVASVWAGARTRVKRRLPGNVVAAQVPVRYGRLQVITPSFVRYCHRLGLQVHAWTIDDPTEMHYLLDLGVDGIMTDRIEVLRDVFIARGHWPSP